MSVTKKRMGRPPGQVHDTPVHLRVSGELVARLDAVAARVGASGVSRSALIRLCVQLGLRLAEEDPRVLVRPEVVRSESREKKPTMTKA